MRDRGAVEVQDRMTQLRAAVGIDRSDLVLPREVTEAFYGMDRGFRLDSVRESGPCCQVIDDSANMWSP